MLFAHPLEREHQVEHADVAGIGILFGIDCAEIEKTECIEPVIDGDHDNVAAMA